MRAPKAGSCACLRSPAPGDPLCLRTRPPSPNRGCRASMRCCALASWRRPARHGRSSNASTRRCGRRLLRTRCATGWRSKAPNRCQVRRKNTLSTSTMKRPNGRRSSRPPVRRRNSCPMNFEFTEEQRLFADAVHKFAVAELEADALKRAHNPRFPFDVAQRMSRHGLMGITLPEADGGQGGSLMDAVIAIEQVALACPRSADVVQSGSFGPIRTFAEYAPPALKVKYLPDLLPGRTVTSLGMSEPDVGSASPSIQNSARPHGAHYVI